MAEDNSTTADSVVYGGSVKEKVSQMLKFRTGKLGKLTLKINIVIDLMTDNKNI